MVVPLTHAWRSWRSARGVAALAVTAFAVGFGSATAVYTVVNGVMLKPLPYPNGERFVALYGGRLSEPGQRSASTLADLLEYQQRARSFDVFGWLRPASFNLLFADQPQHVQGVMVTPSLAHNLGVQPAVGRWFADPSEAVISSPLFARLGSDSSIVGKALSLDDRSFTIVGVMPPGFRLPVPGPGVEHVSSDVWTVLDPLGKGLNPESGAYFAYGRLKPGVTLAQADADVKRVASDIAASRPASHESYTARLDDLTASIAIEIRPTLVLLMVAAGMLVLITCADVAGLLLARSIARAHETAIRIALGASRLQLAVQYFLEGICVALPGAAAGLLVSVLLVRAILALAAEHIPRADAIVIDWSVVSFAAGITVLGSALASLAPLWQARKTAPLDALNSGTRTTTGVRSRRLSEHLVIAQIAIAFTLLTGGALLASHLRTLSRTNPGFDPAGVLTFHVTAADNVEHPEERLAYQQRFTAALEGIPGVSSAGFANQLPLAGCCFSTTIQAEGQAIEPAAVQRTSFMTVSPGYFTTMRLPLQSGRFLDERDARDDALHTLVSRAAALHYWPNRNPIGAFGRLGGPEGSRFEVVGVVGDVRNNGLGKPPVPEIYLSSSLLEVNPMRFVVRSTLPPETLVPEVRRAIRTVNPTLPIHDVAMLDRIVQGSVSYERVGSFMVTFFALAALLMATLGIYGVVAYAVRRERVEIGTRMALGAERRDVLKLVAARGARMTAFGAVLGGACVAATAWILVRVFEIPALTLSPFVLATAVVGLVTGIASAIPAWRATTLSPMVAIRNEPRSTWRSASEPPLQPDVTASSDVDVLSEFVAAARAADSFSDAYRLALTTLCREFGAASAFLFENVSGEFRCVASVPEAGTPIPSIPAGGFLASRLRFYGHPLPIRADDIASWMRWAEAGSARHIPEITALSEIGAAIVVPLRTKGEIIGMLIMGRPGERAGYGFGDRRVLAHCGAQLTLMIENARLTARILEQEKLRRDLALAAEVQRRLLPSEPPLLSAGGLAAVSLPARTVGGDYYDFIDMGDHTIGIALADIAGKGIAAALIMAVVQASLRIVAAESGASLPELAARLNAFLHRSTGSNSYATFFYAQLDERHRQLRYVNAGHNPPYLIRSVNVAKGSAEGTTEIQELKTGGTVIGLFPDMAYEQGTVDLQPGDVLIAFTDGVTEALNASEQEFGEERLKDAVRGLLHLPAAEISVRLSEELRRWIKDAAQYDDLTFVVLKVAS
jgi:putative ABC transport system permease protein